MAKPPGWRKQPARHALASRGVKTTPRHDSGSLVVGSKSTAYSVAQRTNDAYEFDVHYDEDEWVRIAEFLLKKGYSTRAVEEILRSKYMRWASDEYSGDQMRVDMFKSYFDREQKAVNGMLRAECHLSAEDLP